jgi:uncharacterized metal-binding protein
VRPRRDLPLIYSCSGCSNLAQLANHVAVTLDRRGAAEMSCIAGVGGDVPALVRVATSGRPIVVVDGCALRAHVSALARHGVEPRVHHVLTEWGLTKRQHEDFSASDAADAIARVGASVVEVGPS